MSLMTLSGKSMKFSRMFIAIIFMKFEVTGKLTVHANMID